MVRGNKSVKDRGKFKEEIHAALYKNENVRNMLLGDTSGFTKLQLKEEFKKHVKSHLFLDETVLEADMFIYYDIVMPSLRTHTKECRVIMYIICHRDIIENDIYIDGYTGNRVDILSQMVEESLLDEEVINNFGIGELNLDSIGIYNASRFYGCTMEYVVPNFR